MRRRSFAVATAGVTLSGSWRALAADAYPVRPIQVIVPYAAGGADSYVRALGPALEKRHGVRMVIESLVGAGGTLGTNKVRRSAPDGYTILFCGSGALTIAPRLQTNPAPVATDFMPLVNLITIPYIIATKKGSPLQDMRRLFDHIRNNPGALTYGSPGIGSAPHLGMEALARHLKSSVTHIPYSGIATAMQALLGGHVDAVIGAPSTVMPQAEAGSVIPLVVTGKERFPLTPDIPALGEVGIDVDVATHFAFYAPKGTPEPVVSKLTSAFSDASTDPGFKQAMDAARTRVDLLSADALMRVLADEQARFAPIIAMIKLK